jgi:hypothetical protein
MLDENEIETCETCGKKKCTDCDICSNKLALVKQKMGDEIVTHHLCENCYADRLMTGDI